MRKNETVRVTVEDINNLGYGVGHLDGLTVFVRGGVTGETVTAKVIKVTKSYLVALAQDIPEPSPNRCAPDCGSYPACGGCVYRHITYAHELELKRAYVRNAFRKAGVDAEVEAVRTTGKTEGYRNKAQYPISKNPKTGALEVGFYAGSSHRLVPAEGCRLQPAVFGRISHDVVRFLTEHSVSAYDEETHSGLVRHLYLRRGEETGEVLLCLVLNGSGFPEEAAFAAEMTARCPEIVGVLLNENSAQTNVVLGERYRLLAGKDYLTDRLCGLTYRISPESFYQVNHDACELLYGLAKERAGLTGRERLIDLYCGIGTIGLTMADRAAEVLGLEIVPQAVECARENALRNGIANARFVCGDAGDPETLLGKAARLSGGDLSDAVVVLDPPRKGTTRELIAALDAYRTPRVVYISCNPDTLARDCAVFANHGYRLSPVTPVDLFPRTGHVESVCLLESVKWSR
ncbi:MAG TPA: 23S rRNA (uracil(1939)-C(5))-methyltransferase RlmD [Clostridiales bacterium]|nr:23S rRNA (uracil(1939)-C(5))-methyltransferase RlmD [Clostridiales bacterium]